MSDQTFVKIKGNLGTVTQKVAARNGIGGKMVEKKPKIEFLIKNC